MNFKNFYQQGNTPISFEIFPPKDEAGITSLFSALNDLKSFDPAFISVTYGAMGSTRDLTRDLAVRVNRELSIPTAFHFTCVGSGREDIRSYVQKLKDEGIQLVVALRGDPPRGATKFEKPVDGFGYANELVGFLKDMDGFSIAVAGYPEGHIEASGKEADLQNLKRKVDAGADIVLTQLFFDNADYFDFVSRARAVGINIPIVPGIMPVQSLKQIEKVSMMCGAKIPKKLHEDLKSCAADVDAMREVGINHAIAQCRDLKACGVPGIHFYILNKSESVKNILQGL